MEGNNKNDINEIDVMVGDEAENKSMLESKETVSYTHLLGTKICMYHKSNFLLLIIWLLSLYVMRCMCLLFVFRLFKLFITSVCYKYS